MVDLTQVTAPWTTDVKHLKGVPILDSRATPGGLGTVRTDVGLGEIKPGGRRGGTTAAAAAIRRDGQHLSPGAGAAEGEMPFPGRMRRRFASTNVGRLRDDFASHYGIRIAGSAIRTSVPRFSADALADERVTGAKQNKTSSKPSIRPTTPSRLPGSLLVKLKLVVLPPKLRCRTWAKKPRKQ